MQRGYPAFTILILLWLSTALPATADGWTLQQAVDRALAHNAAFRAELARRAEVEGAVIEVGADAWPQVELVGAWDRSRNPSLLNSPDFDDILSQFPDFRPGEQELWTLAVTLEQPLYTGGKVRAAIDLAELVVEVTDAQIRTARLDLALQTAEAFFELRKAREARRRLGVQRQSREAALKVTQDRYDLGEATELERLRAAAAVAEVDPEIARVGGTVRSWESRLRRLLGLSPDDPLDFAADEPVPGDAAAPAAATPEMLPDPTTLLSLAVEHRPELRDLDLQLAALDRQKTVTRADGRPRVDLSGAYGRQVRLPEDFEDDLFVDWRVQVGMTWSLFDGGRRRGQIAQLDSQKEQLRLRREDLLGAILFELEVASTEAVTARERLRAAGTAHRATAEALRVAEESYRLGVALQADLLDAQDQAVRQELAASEARYDLQIALARLRRAAGRMPTAPLVPETDPDPEEPPVP